MSIFENIKRIKAEYDQSKIKEFAGKTIDVVAEEVKDKTELVKKKYDDKKGRVFLRCKTCHHCEEINKELFVKIIGGSTVGFGAAAWHGYLLAGTGFAMPLCIAIVAGGVAIAAFSKELTEWFSSKYNCHNCGQNDWETITEKELVLEEEIKEKEFIIESQKAHNDDSFFERYNSVDIIPVLHKLYEEAEEYIYISYGWISVKCVKDDLPYLQQAANRGVRITVYYGIEPLKDRKNGKYNESCLIKLKNTVDAVKYLEDNLPGTARFVLTDTHVKITACEKYTLHGSHNLLSYRPEEVSRAEYTDKTNQPKQIKADIDTVLNQTPRPELELLTKNL